MPVAIQAGRPNALTIDPGALPAVNISGFQRSGKSILATLLAGELSAAGYERVRVRPLAEPLKEMAKLLTGDPNFSKTKSYPVGPGGAEITGRDVLKKLGTDAIRREFRPDIWLWLARKNADAGELSTVDDCRFPNESTPVDFNIYLDTPAVANDDTHESESHHAHLRERADIVVVRQGEGYWPLLSTVASRVVAWAAVQECFATKELT